MATVDASPPTELTSSRSCSWVDTGLADIRRAAAEGVRSPLGLHGGNPVSPVGPSLGSPRPRRAGRRGRGLRQGWRAGGGGASPLRRQRIGAGYYLEDLLGDLGLAGSVHPQGQAADQVAGVARGVSHR